MQFFIEVSCLAGAQQEKGSEDIKGHFKTVLLNIEAIDSMEASVFKINGHATIVTILSRRGGQNPWISNEAMDAIMNKPYRVLGHSDA